MIQISLIIFTQVNIQITSLRDYKQTSVELLPTPAVGLDVLCLYTFIMFYYIISNNMHNVKIYLTAKTRGSVG